MVYRLPTEPSTEYIRSDTRAGASAIASAWPVSSATARSVRSRWASRALRESRGAASHAAVRLRSRCRASAASVPIAPVDRLSSVWARSRSPSENIWVVVTPHIAARVTLGTSARRTSEIRMEPSRRRAPVRGDIVVLERSDGRGSGGGAQDAIRTCERASREGPKSFDTLPGHPASTGALGRELRDRGDIGLRDERGAGEHRGHPAAADVAVRPVQPQRVHGEIALEIGLLVHGEPDGAVAHRVHEVLVEVEGGDTGLAVRLPDRVDRGEGVLGPQGHDLVDGRVLPQPGGEDARDG